MNERHAPPTSLTRLAVIQAYQPAIDACEELKDIATSARARQLATTARERLMELLDDRLALQGAMDRCPQAYDAICDTERYRRVVKERDELETMITKKVKDTRRQLRGQFEKMIRYSAEASKQALPAGGPYHGPILDRQGSCSLMESRRIHRWLARVDVGCPSEIPPSPPDDEMSWDCLY